MQPLSPGVIIMKHLIVSTLLAGVMLPLAAQEIVPFNDYFVSTRSRADVMAETSAAAAAGDLVTQGEIVTYPSPVPQRSSPTRAEVRAELARAAAAGELSTQNEITWEPPMIAGHGRAQLASGGVTR
jgi:hypothetical protein